MSEMAVMTKTKSPKQAKWPRRQNKTTIMTAKNPQQKHLEFTFSIKALSFDSRTSIRAHKHILYLK